MLSLFVVWGVLRNILLNTLNPVKYMICKDFDIGLYWYIPV